MHKIDTDGADNGQFRDENILLGQGATVLGADWHNAIQDEIVNVIEAADIVLAKNNNAQLLAAIKKIAGPPVGTINAYSGNAAPEGWLICQGQAISRTTYADLWAFAQTSGNMAADGADYTANPGKFGPGNGNTTFQVPDLRGQFVRGLDTAGAIDSEARTIGDAQTDAMQQITGSIGPVQFRNGANASGAFTIGTSGSNGNDSSGGDVSKTVDFDSAGSTRTATETRPKNVAYPYIIKT